MLEISPKGKAGDTPCMVLAIQEVTNSAHSSIGPRMKQTKIEAFDVHNNM
jgi:hypothetical protein